MDVQYYGANCILLSNKDCRIVIDDDIEELGAKPITRPGDIALFTTSSHKRIDAPRLVIDGPGEYEVADLSVIGIAARGHREELGDKGSTIFKILTSDLTYLVLGHIYPDLTDTQIEAIGMVDVMFVPVGGNGYTLDAVGALELIKKIEPKVIIPTHYADDILQYPVEQQELESILKNLGMEAQQTFAKLRFKAADLGSVTTQLILLTRT